MASRLKIEAIYVLFANLQSIPNLIDSFQFRIQFLSSYMLGKLLVLLLVSILPYSYSYKMFSWIVNKRNKNGPINKLSDNEF